jgi:hypothetical protein
MTASRRDSNEAEIVAAIRKIGATWVPMDREQGFDGLLLYRGKLHIVEIKHKSTRSHLTDNEWQMKFEAERQGCDYNVICSVDELMELLNKAVV